MANFAVFTSTGMTTDKLWGTWNGTLVASPSEYRVFLMDGTTVRYLSPDNSFTYTGGPATQQPAGGNYTSIEIITVVGPVVTVRATLYNFGAQPLTAVFSDPDATVLAGSDFLSGSSGNDTLRGFGGDDTLASSAGIDQLFGGDGSDLFSFNFFETQLPGEVVDGGIGGTNMDRLEISNNIGLDHITFFSIEGLLYSGAGSNSAFINGSQIGGGALSTALAISGSSSNDLLAIGLTTTTHLDLSGFTFTNWSAADTILLQGDSSAETVIGTGQNDFFQSIDGADSLYGGGGDDVFDVVFLVVAGQIFDGGQGQDTLSIRSIGGDMSSHSITSIERLVYATGGFTSLTFDDVQVGAGLSTALSVTGSSNIDILDFQMGALTALDLSAFTFANWSSSLDQIKIVGDNDAETLIGSVLGDSIDGGLGNDTLIGGLGNDTLNGGANTAAGDTADLALATTALTVTLDASGYGTASATGIDTDTLIGIENLIGGSAGDTLTGNTSANRLTGNGGADLLFGNAGNDTLDGGLAADYIDGAADNDSIIGGDGADALVGGTGADTVDGGIGNDVILLGDYIIVTADTGNDSALGGAGDDLLWGYGGNDTLNGGDDNDALVGNDFGSALVTGTDLMTGGNGNDTFFVGLAGNASMDGGAGADSFYGHNANDTIIGGSGSDYMFGAGGADTFRLRAADIQNGDVDIFYFFSAAEADRLEIDVALQGTLSFSNFTANLPGIGAVDSVFVSSNASTWSAVVYGQTAAQLAAATFFV